MTKTSSSLSCAKETDGLLKSYMLSSSLTTAWQKLQIGETYSIINDKYWSTEFIIT